MVEDYEFWDPEKETYKEYKQRTKGKGMRGGMGLKKNPKIPEGGLSKLRDRALQRARYKCEWVDCNESRWLELAHIKDIGMGGRDAKIKYEFDNVCILCKYHHDIYDGRNTKGTKRAMISLLKAYLQLKYKQPS